MSCVIALANQKGGVGKTTSVMNLAFALHNRGKRVLALDVDPQASLTLYFRHDPLALEEKQQTIYWSLCQDGTEFDTLVITGPPDLVPASIQLAQSEQEFAQDWDSVSFIKDKLRSIRHQYDFILLDCPPSLTLLTINALVAADLVLIPVKTDFLSMMGIPLLLKTIENIKRKPNPHLDILGVLPTLFDRRNRHDNDALEQLHSSWGHAYPIFEAINRSTAYDRAAVIGRATVELDPRAPGAQHYNHLADYIVSYEQKT